MITENDDCTRNEEWKHRTNPNQISQSRSVNYDYTLNQLSIGTCSLSQIILYSTFKCTRPFYFFFFFPPLSAYGSEQPFVPIIPHHIVIKSSSRRSIRTYCCHRGEKERRKKEKKNNKKYCVKLGVTRLGQLSHADNNSWIFRAWGSQIVRKNLEKNQCFGLPSKYRGRFLHDPVNI